MLFFMHDTFPPILVGRRRGLGRVSVAAGLLGLRVRIPPRAWMSLVSCVLSGKGLCDGPITHPTECGVPECDLETSPECGLGPLGLSSHKNCHFPESNRITCSFGHNSPL